MYYDKHTFNRSTQAQSYLQNAADSNVMNIEIMYFFLFVTALSLDMIQSVMHQTNDDL